MVAARAMELQDRIDMSVSAGVDVRVTLVTGSPAGLSAIKPSRVARPEASLRRAAGDPSEALRRRKA